MKKNLLILSVLLMTLVSCNKKNENPFFNEWGTKFDVPAFSKIKNRHYIPAFNKAIEENKADIDKIVNNTAKPTFKNTIEAYEKAGKLLDKVSGVFYNLVGANTNDSMKLISEEIAPKLSQLGDDIKLNAKLFIKIKSVYDQKEKLNLSSEETVLLEKIYLSFVRGGANLHSDKQSAFRKINADLALLTLKFGDNVLNATNDFKLVIKNKEDLDGLPKSSIESAKVKNEWMFTISKPCLIPFLQFSTKRELREKMFKAYVNKCETDNSKIASQIASLRVKRANLLGYKSHAAYILEVNMSKNSKNVYNFLDKIWKPALETAKNEVKELQEIINKEGGKFKLKAWDWWFYSEKLKKIKYNLTDEELRPFFEINNVRNGAFAVATKLYGITFTERKDLPIYQDDVKTFEVKEADGTHIGILYVDYFARESKRGGAWMNSIHKQSGWGTKNAISPVIMNVCNFTKPAGTGPALISLEQATTLFHEFGHALHGLLSRCKYNYLSGTSVARDFVELPSQVMENWATNPEVLKMYAKNYKTGEVISDELIAKIGNSAKFNQGFVTVEYMSAAYLDLDWHTLTTPELKDALKFEKDALDGLGLIDEIVVRYRTPYFNHIFAGGYSAGYYGYLWAAQLDADAFAAFSETSIFNQKFAKAFRKCILEKGGTVDAMQMYKNFRGRDANPEALLKRKGLL